MGVVIGGIVGASLGKSFSDRKSKINTLQQQAGQLRLWRDTIDDTRRLRTEFRRLHLAGDSAADGIRKKLDEETITASRAIYTTTGPGPGQLDALHGREIATLERDQAKDRAVD